MISEFCDILKVTTADVLGTGLRREATDARHLYWKMLRNSGMTYQMIGRVCDRDHSTIVAGVRSVNARIDTEPAYAEMWQLVMNIKRYER